LIRFVSIGLGAAAAGRAVPVMSLRSVLLRPRSKRTSGNVQGSPGTRPVHFHLNDCLEFEISDHGISFSAAVAPHEVKCSELLVELGSSRGRFSAPFTLDEFMLWRRFTGVSSQLSSDGLLSVLTVRTEPSEPNRAAALAVERDRAPA
jgi:hypothetical protein